MKEYVQKRFLLSRVPGSCNKDSRCLPKTIHVCSSKNKTIQKEMNIQNKDQESVLVDALNEILEYAKTRHRTLYVYLEHNQNLFHRSLEETGIPDFYVIMDPSNFISDKNGILITDNQLIQGYEFPVILSLMDKDVQEKVPITVDLKYRAVSSSNSVLLSG